MWSCFPPRVLVFHMFQNFLLRQRLPCIPFRAPFPFSFFRILRPVSQRMFCCARFALYVSICGEPLVLLNNRPRRLFVSPRRLSCAMSKNGISFLLREVIVHSGASSEGGAAPRAHSIRGIATSSAFFKN